MDLVQSNFKSLCLYQIFNYRAHKRFSKQQFYTFRCK